MAFLPAVLPIVGGLLTVAGTVMSIKANNAQAVNQYEAAQYQAAVAQNNAKIAAANAAKASQQSQLEQQRKDAEARAQLGTQMAVQAASGLDVLGRSQLQVREGTRKNRASAAQDIRSRGDAEVLRHLQEAANFESDAKLYERGGKNAIEEAKFANIGALIGGASSLVGNASSISKSFKKKSLV